jgi:hypothetical protein
MHYMEALSTTAYFTAVNYSHKFVINTCQAVTKIVTFYII